MSNTQFKALIEITGIKAYFTYLPVLGTGTVTKNSIVVGLSSNATAVLSDITNLTGSTVNLRMKKVRGSFINGEALTIAGTPGFTCTGKAFVNDDFYTNTEDNVQIGVIEAGIWKLYSTQPPEDGPVLLTKIDASFSTVNVEPGFGISAGFYFSFNIRNNGLAEVLFSDGVYLENSDVTYYVDIGDGDGYVKEWTGVIKTTPVISETDIRFKCIESNKSGTDTVGSKKVPTCLNLNYNCKLVIDSEGKDYIQIGVDQIGDPLYYSYAFDINKKFTGDGATSVSISYIVPVLEDYNTILIPVLLSSDWYTILTTNHEGLQIECAAGPNAGKIYNILAVEDQGFYAVGGAAYLMLYLDDSVLEITPFLSQGPLAPVTAIKLLNYSNVYNLSESDAWVHDKNTSYTKTLTSYESKRDDADIESYLTKNVNFTNTNKQVTVSGINANGSIDAVTTNEIDTSLLTFTTIYNDLDDRDLFPNALHRKWLTIIIPLTNSLRINQYDGDLYLDMGTIDFVTDTSDFSTVRSSMSIDVNCSANYNANIIPLTGNKVEIIKETIFASSDPIVNNIISFKIVVPFKKLLFENIYDPAIFNYSEIRLEVKLSMHRISTPTIANFEITDVILNGFNYVRYNETSIDTLGIGCSGQNVQVGNKYETVSNTIKYIQTELAGTDISEINEPAYDQAEIDFRLYPNNAYRNAGHQIIDQIDKDNLLLKILEDYNLALVRNKSGLWELKNWLPKSTVFSDTSAEYSFNPSNWESIGKLEIGSIETIISDIKLDFTLKEASGKYAHSIRVLNTNDVSFNIANNFEGTVTSSATALIEQIFYLLNAGAKRIKKQAQLSLKSDFIKSPKPDDSDYSSMAEALVSIRNKAGWLNKPINTVPIICEINSANRSLDLLSFVDVTDPIVTEGAVRKGWVVSRKLLFDDRRYEFEILFDIHPNDPLKIQIGKIVKGNFPDIINNGNFPDKITNGPGVL